MKKLDLSQNGIKDISSLADGLAKNESLEILMLSDNPITQFGSLAESVAQNTALRNLLIDEAPSEVKAAWTQK